MRDEFKTTILNETGVAATTAIANIMGEALEKLERIVPKSREAALMVTNLQQASFWAKKAVAMAPGNERVTTGRGVDEEH